MFFPKLYQRLFGKTDSFEPKNIDEEKSKSTEEIKMVSSQKLFSPINLPPQREQCSSYSQSSETPRKSPKISRLETHTKSLKSIVKPSKQPSSPVLTPFHASFIPRSQVSKTHTFKQKTPKRSDFSATTADYRRIYKRKHPTTSGYRPPQPFIQYSH